MHNMAEHEALIAEKRSQIDKAREDMVSWYKGLSKDKFGRNLEPMGPPGIEHEALTKMQDKMLSLEVNHRGLEAIAPDIDKQTVYVLREMADAASSLLATSMSQPSAPHCFWTNAIRVSGRKDTI